MRAHLSQQRREFLNFRGRSALRRDLLKPVFVMQPAEDRLCHHAMTLRNLVSILCERRWKAFSRIWNSRPEAGVRPAPVVVRYPLGEQDPQMLLTKRNKVIKAFSSDRAIQSFAK